MESALNLLSSVDPALWLGPMLLGGGAAAMYVLRKPSEGASMAVKGLATLTERQEALLEDQKRDLGALRALIVELQAGLRECRRDHDACELRAAEMELRITRLEHEGDR